MTGILLIGLAGLAVILGGATLLRRSRRLPDTVEVFGPFEVVTHYRRYLTGWNEGPVHRTVHETWSMRYRSRPFAVEGKAGARDGEARLYENPAAVITFPSPEPALVIVVGDPPDAGFYYLVHERDGEAVTRLLGPTSGGVSADWLDAPPGAAQQERNLYRHRGRLEGGRWLLLGNLAVLDTRTLECHALRMPDGVYLDNLKPPVALAPDAGSFVRLGHIPGPENTPRLVVFNIDRETAVVLPVDRSRMRYCDPGEIDADWLDHHFVWTTAVDGQLVLAERQGFTPLPYRGVLSPRTPDGYRAYNLQPVKPAMLDRFLVFLENEFRAERLPRDEHSVSDTLRVGPDEIHVMLLKDSLGVFMYRETDTRPVEEIAVAFDALLRTGELDNLFGPEPSKL